MTNAEKYQFSDFTRENYRKLLQLAKTKYSFRTFENIKDGKNKCVVWRHDVDFSVHSALKLAQIEKEEQIVSTYFILMHSEFYNLFEKEIANSIKQILLLGHSIGLHFDSHYYNVEDEKKMEAHLIFEKDILEDMFQVQIEVFSFHNTTPFTMSCQEWQYGGMLNTYAEYFQKQVAYCSDSNGYWRFKRLEDVLLESLDEKLQVLTHPELWQEEIMSPKQRIYRCADLRAEKSKRNYDKLLKLNGRMNIDW